MRKKDPVCPLVKKACLQDGCMFWVHMLGKNPQTGHDVDEWDCSFRWMPMLMVENARRTLGAQAAVESMRNEVVERQDILNRAVVLARTTQVREVEAEAPDRISDGRETKPQFGN